MRRRRGSKVNGTPTVNPSRPQAIDDYSGFKVPLEALKKDWAGLYSKHPDIRNPQDFVRGIKDNQNLPFARPETPDQFTAGPIIWEDGEFITTQSGGNNLLTQGIDPSDTL